MNLSTPAKAIALVVFLAAIAGATYGVRVYLGDSLGGQLVAGDAEQEVLNATPGHAVTYAVTVENRRDDEAVFLATLTGPGGVTGTSAPQVVAAGKSATVLVPVDIPAGTPPGDHALRLTVASADGSTSRAYEEAATLHVLAPDEVLMGSVAQDALNATAGHQITYAVTLQNRRDDASADLVATLAGPEGVAGTSARQTVAAGKSATVFVSVDVPAGTPPGDHPLRLTVATADGSASRPFDDAATLRVLAPADGFQPGETARVVYTGRLASNGRVFNTNDLKLERLDFPKTETYRFSAGGSFEVRTSPRPSVVQGFYEGLLGMQPGETRTVTFSPEKGYGNATIEETVPREEVIERRETITLPTPALTVDEFAGFLTDTNQGVPGDYEVGETVRNEREGEVYVYRITEKTADQVKLILHLEVGERHTLHQQWSNASAVESVNATHAVFVTTPTTAPDEAFTFHPHWPDMSRIVRVDDESIVVRHDPPVGNTYTQGGFQGTQEYTVVSVGDDVIVVSTPSTSPLAGQTLTFDILLLERLPGA